MILSMVILIIAAVLASGSIFAHKRMLTFLAAAGTLWQAGWLFLTLIDRTILLNIPSSIVFLIGSLTLLGLSSLQYRTWQLPYQIEPGTGKRDMFIFFPLLIVIAAAALISSYNGFFDHKWISHGFYNGDTATLLSLTQRAFSDQGLLHENPFAGGGYLEYPTLLHAGIATFYASLNVQHGWIQFLPSMTYAQILITIPLFFLLWDAVTPEPDRKKKWLGLSNHWIVHLLQTGITMYVLAVSWDSYIYPQSHFFLTGIFLLAAVLFQQAYKTTGKQQLPAVITASMCTIVLLFSNAVTGTAAVGLALIFAAQRAFSSKRAMVERQLFIASGIVLALLFFISTPGDANFSLPGLSYTGAFDMLRLAIVVAPLIIAVFQQLSKHSYISVSVSLLSLLAFVTFFFSGRDIVVGNASRFFYHALLAGFPLLLTLLIQLYQTVIHELHRKARSLPEKVGGWAGVIVLLLLAALPAGGSIASAHDNLMFKDEQVVRTSMRDALWWIQEQTAPDAVFISSPQPPFAIPAFTGRSILRVDFWLSPSDATYMLLIEAYEGNTDAQQALISQADYILLMTEQQPQWQETLSALPRVFVNGAVAIYATK